MTKGLQIDAHSAQNARPACTVQWVNPTFFVTLFCNPTDVKWLFLSLRDATLHPNSSRWFCARYIAMQHGAAMCKKRLFLGVKQALYH